MLLVLLCRGPGAWSIDHLLMRKLDLAGSALRSSTAGGLGDS
jgi:hypothetical protein